MERPYKRQKLGEDDLDASDIRTKRANFLASLSRDVSPPSDRVAIISKRSSNSTEGTGSNNVIDLTSTTPPASSMRNGSTSATHQLPGCIPSPIQLTRIQDLPEKDNKDTVSLSDILGDPLIKEAWIFNFCFDIDWLMQHFDADVRHLVKVKIVHGSWRREDTNKIMIDEACGRLANVDAIQAYLPDAFGTHHSKMFILFRHDDTAQVIIHTANMLEKDWKNMTQAVWRSPVLPKSSLTEEVRDIGSGSRFKYDLLRYLKSYGSKLKGLVSDLDKHSFDDVKAALVASVPSKLKTEDANAWGHEALRRVVKEIPVSSKNPHFVFQVSSIASLPATWLKDTLYQAMNSSAANTSFIFPTAEDVRISLDGYYAGGSIHTKAQSDAHLKQISALHPQLCRWAAAGSFDAGRLVAAPHIKTYVRFAALPTETAPGPDIEWALVTSANLSTQAWGAVAKPPKGLKDAREAIVHVQSYEIGVMVWPALFAGDGGASKAKMVPVFRKDSPQGGDSGQRIIGFRMPYDLPLTPYGHREMPWSPHSMYNIPDSQGLTWPPTGY